MRQEQQQNLLRVPGMMQGGINGMNGMHGMNGMNGMNEYQHMLYRQQNGGDLRHKALQNQNRNFGQYADSFHLVPVALG